MVAFYETLFVFVSTLMNTSGLKTLSETFTERHNYILIINYSEKRYIILMNLKTIYETF